MNIEQLDPKSLTAYDNNTRTHSHEQVQEIAASINQFGFNDPLEIDEDNLILSGHGRLQAAKLLGLETVPCIRHTHLTDAEKRGYNIAHNKIADNAGWDSDALADELADLSGQIDLQVTGFSDQEIAALTDPNPEPSINKIREAEAAAQKETESKPESDFEKQMQDQTQTGQLPIVPQYAEEHEAFIIICDNSIDAAWIRNQLALEKPQQSYKDAKTQRANVITVAQLRELMQ